MLSQEGPFTLSIPNGGTDSPALSTVVPSIGVLQTILQMVRSWAISAPAALTAAITVQVASTVGGVDWVTLQYLGTDFGIAAGKQNILPSSGGFKDMRIHSAGAEGAQRDFLVWAKTQR